MEKDWKEKNANSAEEWPLKWWQQGWLAWEARVSITWMMNR